MLCTISDIEKLTYNVALGLAEFPVDIKGFDILFVDFDNGFGYSMLVFKNGKHIYYANDYELHYSHGNYNHQQLREMYIAKANKFLFTEEELLSPVQSYDDYKRKSYFVRNYWIMQYDHQSAFVICDYNGNPPKSWEDENKSYPYMCTVCCSYVKDKQICEWASKYISHLSASFETLKNDDTFFKEMISEELSNHEACITCDYTNALYALGLQWNELTERQKEITKSELKRQIREYDNQ